MAQTKNTSLQDCSGNNWSFMNGDWSNEPDGESAPPEGTEVEYIAVRKNEIYNDFTASFRFRLRNIVSVRFLFRLQDSRRFYALDIPFGGQQFTSRVCWAGIAVADGTPLQRYLSFNLIHGLCARLEFWYEVRIEAIGTHFRAWINDILAADVYDDTYTRGHIGFASIQNPYYESPRFDRLSIEVSAQPAMEPLMLMTPAQHWITPCPATSADVFQSYANIHKYGKNSVLLSLYIGPLYEATGRRIVFIRSEDGGKSWGIPMPATLKDGLSAPFTKQDGTWVCVFINAADTKDHLYSFESKDEGISWTGPMPLKISGGWPSGWMAASMWRPIRLQDGAVIVPFIGYPVNQPHFEDEPSDNEGIYRQYYTAMVIRSEDDGETWSAPVVCDAFTDVPNIPWSYHMPLNIYGGRSYEVGMDEIEPGVLLGIGRPGTDPYMWQLMSEDGGRSWEPASIGHFPGYCPSLTKTACGAIVATTRFPFFAAHVSRDGGRTWSLPVIIDYCAWTNQQAVEIEPDVVLLTYMGKMMEPGEPDSRITRIKVTDQGLVLDNKK